MISVIAKTIILLFLIWVSVHDIKYRKIENFAHFIIIALAFFVNSITLPERVFGFIICFIPIFIANIISKNGIGMGDVKLSGAFGFTLGAYGGLFSAIAGLSLMLLSFGVYKLYIKSRSETAGGGSPLVMPVAPFLSAGFAIILLI